MRRLGYITSHLYPFGFADRAGCSATLVGGVLEQPPTLFIEHATSSAVLVEGWMRDPIQTTAMPKDTATSAATLVSGSMETKLIVYSVPRETASSTANLVSGTLE